MLKKLFAWLPSFYEQARAKVEGGPLAPEIKGMVYFRDIPEGVVVSARITGLPEYRAADNDNPVGPHGFHIHQVGDCTVSDPQNPFQEAGMHYDPDNQPHGNHAGDLPNLFSNHGCARMSVYTDRFKVEDIIGRAVIIHKHPNDFRTQPAGAAGPRLACGIIERI